MKSIGSRATMMLIAFMTILCIVAVTIAVNVAAMDYKRQHQILKDIPEITDDGMQGTAKIINTGKLVEQELYYNGQKVKNAHVYLTDTKKMLLPLEDILKLIGADYKYFSADDILEAEIAGKKMVIKLGRDSVLYGQREIKLTQAPDAARGRILVPWEAFVIIDGMRLSSYAGKNTVFMNYYKNFDNEKDRNLKILKVERGVGSILDMMKKKVVWQRGERLQTSNDYGYRYETFEASPNLDNYMLKSGDEVFLINKSNYNKLLIPGTASSASWSRDGKYLYWIDRENGKSHVYVLTTGEIKEIGEYQSRMAENSITGYNILKDYSEYKNHRAVSFINPISDKAYTFIERNGKAVVEGPVDYSPDRSKILFVKGAQYQVANADGSGLVELEECLSAMWINNSKLMINTGSESYLYDLRDKSRTKADGEWKYLGQDPQGQAFYMNKSILFRETGKGEEKIMDAYSNWDTIYSPEGQGPYVALSGAQNSVSIINGNTAVQIGKYDALLRGMDRYNSRLDYKRSISLAPDKTKMILFQKEGGFLTLNLFSVSGTLVKHIILNHMILDESIADSIDSKWLSNDEMIVYSPKQAWVVNFKEDIKVYEWVEAQGSTIEGVLN